MNPKKDMNPEPNKDRPTGKSPFDIHAERVRVGTKCVNCPHAHTDHSLYDPRRCYFPNCNCVGLKLEEVKKPISPDGFEQSENDKKQDRH
jgi:hypothetical protein